MAVLPNMLKSIPKETAIVIVDNASSDTARLSNYKRSKYYTHFEQKK